MSSRRVPNWEEALSSFIEQKRHCPFQWGQNDCILFAADWVRTLTGTDLAEAYRGNYTDAKGAARILLEFDDLPALVQHFITKAGGVEIPALLAQRGDVVIATMEGSLIVGVCVGASSIFPGEHCILFHPTIDTVKTAWRIN